ncbi:hypothetical protein PRUPE_3G128300 [Prunus persica]|uniref:Isopropylmalate dehydrogenase-like domain-containing protein n=1 Tax=Prunus persica TaxID=3760 RepID=A0A251PZJ9_PRUPE|nr:hypothetical protein PRUPE_3G128300 [Prunus persica]
MNCIDFESCREVATKYPGINYKEIIVGNCCMQLVSKPDQFDVMVNKGQRSWSSTDGGRR